MVRLRLPRNVGAATATPERRRWAVVGLAILALFLSAAPAGAQFTSIPYLRWRYFHDQRAFPFQTIPPQALQTAREDYLRRWPPPPLGSAPTIPGSVWGPIGPDNIPNFFIQSAGRVATVAIHPTDSNTIYVGAAQGGVWKTTNGGASWTPLTDTQCSLAMGALAIDPVNPNIVYAGTGEENFASDSYYGCGVLKSTDGGTTWTQVGASTFDTSTGGARISRLVIQSSTAGSTTTTTLLVASDFGVYRSTDSGSTWTQVLTGTATDILFDPTNSSIAYVALGIPGGSASNGVYKSTNAGNSWTKLSGGFPTSNVGRINLAIAASAPSTLYASVQNTSSSSFGSLLGIFVTTNGGMTWTQLGASGASCTGDNQCWYDMTIAVHPANPQIAYFGANSVFKSTNGGATFSNITGSIHVDQHAFAFDPQNPNVIYAGNDGGLYKSTDAGVSWQSLNTNLAITQFYPGISMHPTDPTPIVMGGTQDNGTLRYTGTTAWTLVLGGDGGYTAVDFNTPTTAYAETQWTPNSGSAGPRRSDNVGSSSFVLKTSGINLSDSARFMPPLVMSPSDPSRLDFGTCRVYRTTNKAESWTAISPSCPTWSGTVTAIAEAPSSSLVIYASTSAGSVRVTIDGGTTWTLITTGLPARFPTALAVHPTVAGTAFVTFSGFGTGHVFMTTNTGANWTDISGDLLNVPVNAILVDPGDPTNTIYIGTDLGVFKTSNGGTNWSPLNNGLPNVAVFDLGFRPGVGVLVAATHGRGMFLLAPPVLTVTPSSLNFGSVTVNTTKDLTFTVQNTGNGTLAGTAAASGAPFSVVAGSPFSLGAGASRTVTVRFSPTSLATFSGNVSFTSNGGSLSRAITGSGTPPDTLTITSPASGTPNPVSSGGAVSLSVSATDSLGHTQNYAWSASCPTLGPNGSFDSTSTRTPTWTAPANTSGSAQNCTVQVVVSDAQGTALSQTGSYTQTVNSVPDTITITSAVSGTPNPVSSGGAVSLSVSATDSLGHTQNYAWSASCPTLGSNGSFNSTSTRTPTWTAPANTTGSTQSCTVQVVVSDAQGTAPSQTSPYTQTVNPLSAPDLVVTALTAPTTGTIGGLINGMSVTVKNQGSATAGSYQLGFYWSTDSTITTGDVSSGWTCSMAAQNPGASQSCTGQVGVPPSLSPGTYYLGAIADDLQQVTEINEQNNARAADTGPIVLTPPPPRAKTFTVPPCRVLDTRLSNPLGPVPANGTRSILVAGNLTGGGTVQQGGATNCGVPDAATGVFVNVVAVNAGGPGHLTVYPFGTSLPLASTLNFTTGQTIANGVLVPICAPTVSCALDLNITMGPAAADLVIDVTGYLAPLP
jgi:hypothetical protein